MNGELAIGEQFRAARAHSRPIMDGLTQLVDIDAFTEVFVVVLAAAGVRRPYEVQVSVCIVEQKGIRHFQSDSSDRTLCGLSSYKLFFP